MISLGQCFRVCGDQCSCDAFREYKRAESNIVEFKMVVIIELHGGKN